MGDTTITLLEGACFCISAERGDIEPTGTQGLFFLDTRLVSELALRVNGEEPELLAAVHDDPFAASFVLRGRPKPGEQDSTLLVERRRYVGQGMREDVIVRNLGDEASYCEVEVRVDADFAELRDVRSGRSKPPPDVAIDVVDDAIELRVKRGGSRALRLACTGAARVLPGSLRFETIIPAGGRWQTCLSFVPVVDGEQIEPRYRCGDPVERSTTAERLARWRRSVPAVETDHAGLGIVIARAAEDLAALRVFDPEVPERAVVAAGAPWSMSLFGRDALLTAWMALIVDPDLALGVLETLARLQGTRVDPGTEEEPGRILCDLRFGHGATLEGSPISYGSADATPLFVMLLGELRRWGLAPELVQRLLPHADRALDWIEQHGDRDGDGYVEYRRATDRGRLHQGWRDAPAIRFADGTPAQPPIALAEVQGYVYAAYVARSHFAREAGEESEATRWQAKAVALREAFNRDFWLADRGHYAVGLDRHKRPIDVLASSMGHCLWTGIVDEAKAPQVAARLVSKEMFTGWGIRTLAATMTGYNPVSYQAGSVWPHDTALAAAGLARYGFVIEAQRIVNGQLEAALAFGGRLPELFAGFARDAFGRPIGYPNACRPAAWAAASPLLSLRTMLRFDPWIPAGRLRLAPMLPADIGRLRIENVPLLGGRITIEVDGGVVKVEGLPSSVELMQEPRPPHAIRDPRDLG